MTIFKNHNSRITLATDGMYVTELIKNGKFILINICKNLTVAKESILKLA